MHVFNTALKALVWMQDCERIAPSQPGEYLIRVTAPTGFHSNIKCFQFCETFESCDFNAARFVCFRRLSSRFVSMDSCKRAPLWAYPQSFQRLE